MGRRNRFVSSTLSCPMCSPSLTPLLSNSLLEESFHVGFCLPLRLFPGTGTSSILLRSCPSHVLLTCPFNFNLFPVIFFFTGALYWSTPLSLLMLSFFVIPHIHLSLLIFLRDSTHQPQPPHLILRDSTHQPQHIHHSS